MCFFFQKPIFGSCRVQWIAEDTKFKSIVAKSLRPDDEHYYIIIMYINISERRLNNIIQGKNRWIKNRCAELI
jgi:hypothetical protein